jgi:hypothetical protein
MGLIQPGTGYNFVNSEDGSSLEILFPPLDPKQLSETLLQQFQIVVVENQLKVVGGTVLWASHNFGGSEEEPGAKCANQSIVNNYARYTGDTVTVGTDSSTPFMSENGYVTLSL